MTQMCDLGRAGRGPARGRSDAGLAKRAAGEVFKRSWRTPRPAATAAAAAARDPQPSRSAMTQLAASAPIRVYLWPVNIRGRRALRSGRRAPGLVQGIT